MCMKTTLITDEILFSDWDEDEVEKAEDWDVAGEKDPDEDEEKEVLDDEDEEEEEDEMDDEM